MSTEPSADDPVEQAVSVLSAAGLVAFPTETVYGLGADADMPSAVRAIFAAKGRPVDHPLILHVADANAVTAWASNIPPQAVKLMAQFWPGPLTLVLPRSSRASNEVTGGQNTVGLRCPSHPWAQRLLRAYGAARGDAAVALAAPSANSYGRISPSQADHVRADLGVKPEGKVDFLLDGGPCDFGIESTIVDFPDGQVRILRPGSIRAEQLAECLGQAVSWAATPGPAGHEPRVSGRLFAHYAPRKPLRLVTAEALRGMVDTCEHPVQVLAIPEVLDTLATAPGVLLTPASPESGPYARDLYRHLHEFDRGDARLMLVVLPGSGPEWLAVTDRLLKASAGSAPLKTQLHSQQ